VRASRGSRLAGIVSGYDGAGNKGTKRQENNDRRTHKRSFFGARRLTGWERAIRRYSVGTRRTEQCGGDEKTETAHGIPLQWCHTPTPKLQPRSPKKPHNPKSNCTSARLWALVQFEILPGLKRGIP